MALHSRTLSWWRLGVGAVVTAICTLSVHVILFQVLHIPDPASYPTAGAPLLISEAAMVLGAVIVWRRAAAYLARYSYAARCLLLFVLLAMLRAQLIRVPVMDAVTTTAWRYALLRNIPQLAPYVAMACLVAGAAPLLRTIWHKAAASFAIAAVTFLVCKPGAAWAFQPVLDRLSFLSHSSVYDPPYGLHVLVPAYVTFLEPVAASLAVAALVWDRLSRRRAARLGQFVLLLMMTDLQLLRPLVYAASRRDDPVGALASAGQFWIEALVLALLTAATWVWSGKARFADAALVPAPGDGTGAGSRG